MLARLVVLMGAIFVMRMAIGVATASWMKHHLSQSGIPAEVGDGTVALPFVGGAPDAPGDPGRANQPIPEDLVADGQVVERDGKLVVLIDASDPDNEVYVPLDGSEGPPPEMPWLLREGLGPAVGATVGGLGLYWVAWALGGLVFGLDRPRSEP